MCGISGIIGNNDTVGDVLEKMTDVIIHRGPDGHGYFYGPGIALGHRRLAIIDLSETGHQPMEYLDRYVITFNGEIYNYIEIRKKLESEGYRFRGHTDTEVILAAFDKWGELCVKHFNGMWAFIIYDKSKNTVFCSRDRYGVKPFYYWVAPDKKIYLGSEIKQFTVIPSWKPQVNSQRAYDFLAFGISNHTDETMFRNVYELGKGCSMHLVLGDIKISESGRLPVTQWYQLVPSEFKGNLEEATTEFKDIFSDSVKLRMRADVSVGSCLSGGLDSSSIVCIMNELLKQEGLAALQKTFSICTEVEHLSEKKWIDDVVSARNIDAYFEYPDLNGLFENLSMITWHQDEPFDNSGIYSQWSVFRLAASKKVKVMLDGQGGDELLAGYSSFFPPRFSGLLKSGELLKFWREINLTKDMHGISQLESVMRVAYRLLPDFARRQFLNIFGGSDHSPSWLNMSILGASPINPYIELGGNIESVQAMSKIQLESTHLPKLLHWEDRDSMAHSIESRCPFLDYRLVEFLVGLPEELKLSSGWTKRILRMGMRGVLPNSVRKRVSKLGFLTPEEVWIKNKGSSLYREKLGEAVESSRGILNGQAFQILEETISGKKPFTSLSWRLISFGEWMRTFSVSV
ncbi:asparagine synthase (glutamine-hydrolyzing) [Nitrospinaceae bacterium]|nr:asparagine synthase (glutamine-hydrolyzing) [Nitrospinaceae bacterium]